VFVEKNKKFKARRCVNSYGSRAMGFELFSPLVLKKKNNTVYSKWIPGEGGIQHLGPKFSLISGFKKKPRNQQNNYRILDCYST